MCPHLMKFCPMQGLTSADLGRKILSGSIKTDSLSCFCGVAGGLLCLCLQCGHVHSRLVLNQTIVYKDLVSTKSGINNIKSVEDNIFIHFMNE